MAAAQSIAHCRADFPILSQLVGGKRLAYLDTASSAQKPQIVIDAMRDVMTTHYANIHRGLYHFSQKTTAAYEQVREKVAAFIINARADEIVFTRNATEAINLLAHSWGLDHLRAGDEIILSGMEHHANIVPWQLIQNQCAFKIKVIPVLADGTLDIEAFSALLSERTKLVSVVHTSNALGTVNPMARIAKMAKDYNPVIKVFVDASQSIVHGGVDVAEMGCDFLAFTGHKLYGPSAGVLWAKADILHSMKPYQGGGDMIERVSFEGTTFKSGVARFEAGTPAIVDVIGLGAAIDYVSDIGMEHIAAHEKTMLDYAMRELSVIDGLTFYGTAQEKAGIISMTAAWASGADIAMILDKQGVAVRVGHHCCMPLMERLGVEGTLRASIGLYTNQDDIDQLVQGLKKAKDFLA